MFWNANYIEVRRFEYAVVVYFGPFFRSTHQIMGGGFADSITTRLYLFFSFYPSVDAFRCRHPKVLRKNPLIHPSSRTCSAIAWCLCAAANQQLICIWEMGSILWVKLVDGVDVCVCWWWEKSKALFCSITINYIDCVNKEKFDWASKNLSWTNTGNRWH